VERVARERNGAAQLEVKSGSSFDRSAAGALVGQRVVSNGVRDSALGRLVPSTTSVSVTRA